MFIVKLFIVELSSFFCIRDAKLVVDLFFKGMIIRVFRVLFIDVDFFLVLVFFRMK